MKMKLTIERKLGLGFGIVLILLLTVSVVGVVSLNRAQTLTNEIIELQELGEAADVLALAQHLERLGLIDYIISGEEDEKAEIEEAQEVYEEQVVILQKAQNFPKLASPAESIIQVTEEMDVLLDEILEAYEANPNDVSSALEALKSVNDFNDATMVPVIEELDNQLKILVEEKTENVTSQVKNMIVVGVVVSLISLIVSTGAAYYISLGVVRSATHLREAADSISRGNLDVLIEVFTGDEMEDLAAAIERMRASLKLAVSRLQTKQASRKSK
jgi:methyl-accepting chemotaxis protein